jgi:hypothetical protein
MNFTNTQSKKKYIVNPDWWMERAVILSLCSYLTYPQFTRMEIIVRNKTTNKTHLIKTTIRKEIRTSRKLTKDIFRAGILRLN